MQNANRCHKHLLKNLEKESRWWVNDKLPLCPVLLFTSCIQFFISFFFPYFCTVSTDECLIVSLASLHLICNILSFLASLPGSQKWSHEYLVYCVIYHLLRQSCAQHTYTFQYYPCRMSRGGFSSWRKIMCSICMEDMMDSPDADVLTSMGTS